MTIYSDIVAKLHESFKSNKTRSFEWRISQLKGLLKFLEVHQETICECLHLDLHKSPFESRIYEIASVRSEVLYAMKNLKTWMKGEPAKDSIQWILYKRRVVYEPLGVVLIIGSWNYPINVSLAPLIGAIAAGNCVLLKPSEISESCSNLLVRYLINYLDPDCFAVLSADAQGTTELLKEKFDYIFYTGSSAIAKIVMKAASANLTPITVECGGKSPCVVFDDSDTSTAAYRIAGGKFLNAGQTCVAPDYVLCFESVYKKFLQDLHKVILEMYGSDPEQSDLCRIINNKHLSRLQNLLKNQNIYCGGTVNADKKYCSPTVITDVKLNDPIMREEIFGPILPVIAVRNAEEAVDYINKLDKPLTLYIFTKSSKNVKYIIRNTTSGSVCVNDTILQLAQKSLPFGGVGLSGFGRYHGKFSYVTFSNQRAIAWRSQGFSWVNRKIYPPYDMKYLRIYERIYDIQFRLPRCLFKYALLIIVCFLSGLYLGFFSKVTLS